MTIYFSDTAKKVSIDQERSCFCDDAMIYKTAYLLYQKAERKAKLRKLFCTLVGRCYTLRDFSQVAGKCSVKNQVNLGTARQWK